MPLRDLSNGPPLNRDGGLSEREVSACLAERQGIAGAAEIVVDGDVTGRHVGQVLQQPEGRELRHAFGGPPIEFERPIRPPALGHAGGEILRQGQHVVRPEHAAKSLRLHAAGLRVGGEQTAVMDRPLGGSHRHLALPAHHLEPLANRLFPLAIERPEIIDVAGESPRFGRMMQRQPRTGK